MKKKHVLMIIEANGGLAEIKKDMFRWYGIKLTKKQTIDALNKCIKNCGYLDCGFDTSCREYIARLIGYEITGMKWPLGEDTQEYTGTFFRKLITVAREKGYTIKASRYAQYFSKMKLRFE